jgi:hypothetical protein
MNLFMKKSYAVCSKEECLNKALGYMINTKLRLSNVSREENYKCACGEPATYCMIELVGGV